ncbi:MAG: glycoside hydrolase family 15 protein [Chthonomonas sp.]|nr:glycoside hydrolase family 15 protein [Chthonomonas sp.]
MPRLFAHGNGRMLVQTDRFGIIRDLYTPHVGLWNHLSGHPIRVGIWVDGAFVWLEDHAWNREASFSAGAVGTLRLHHGALQIDLVIEDVMLPEDRIFLRRFSFTDTANLPREVRLFQTADTRLAETDIGDTAFYHPGLEGMVHFKTTHALLFGGTTDLGSIHQYSTGVKDFAGHVGTWPQAERGELDMRAMDQGSVDSTHSLRLDVPAGGTAAAQTWIMGGHDFADLAQLRSKLRKVGFSTAFAEADSHWSGFVGRADLADHALSDRVRTLVEQSLHYVRTQTNHNGAILAANDSDILRSNRATYSYMWPRDGALVALAMDDAGYPGYAAGHLHFCMPLISESQPFFLHKYSPDGSFGATWHPWIIDGTPEVPFQQDETSLTVLSAVRLLEREPHRPDAGELFDRLVALPADFIARAVDEQTGLPVPSYDLWEERRGIHCYTLATNIAALRAAAGLTNDSTQATRWSRVAESQLAAMLKHLVDPASGRLLRCLSGGKDPQPDSTVDSACLAVGLLGVLPWDHPAMVASYQAVTEMLLMKTGIRGVARYENDYYFRRDHDMPGNPWIICTMWLAQAQLQQARTLDEVREAALWLDWAADRAESTGALSEQFHPHSGEPLSVCPLTWSHAEVIRTAALVSRRTIELSHKGNARPV